MVKPQLFKARVAEYTEFNHKYLFLHLELIEPHALEFEAGQYVSIAIGGGERRAYSIASAPSIKHGVELCIDVEPGGKGTTYLKNLKPGNEVEFLAPLGRFVVNQSAAEKKLLFVATGSGIAPFKSIIFNLLEDKKDEREIWLLWGLRHVEEMFWEEEWRQINEYYKNFHYRLMISKPPGKWPLISGHVDVELNSVALDHDWGVYLCGNQEMIAEVGQIVQNRGVSHDKVHFEKYT